MRGRLRQLGRFCAVGLACLGLSLAVLAGLHGLAGINYLFAYVVAFVVSNIAGYLLNARITFAVKSHQGGAVRYIAVNAVLLGLNAAAMRLLVSGLHVWYIAAALALAAFNAPVSFLAQRRVTYRLGARSRAPGL